MPAAERILVVDDEPAIIRTLSAVLRARGYDVVVAPDGRQALAKAAGSSPEVIILDLGLPDIDGVEVCRRIREWSDVPVIVLTAEGSDERKVEALDEGADDYVTKPFSTPELLARVRVALRHRRPASTSAPSVLQVGELVVDVGDHRVTMRGEEVHLTRKEFGMLRVLAQHPGRIVTHHALLAEVWGDEYHDEVQYLRVYASHLRRKLQDDPERPYLVTEPGVGFRLVDPTRE